MAESCTGGLMAGRLTDRSGSSAFFAGGVVAYSNEAKHELVGVEHELIERFGAVSTEVAEALALGAIARFDADIGVGITGIAGPEGGSEEKPVGTVCFSVLSGEGRGNHPQHETSRRASRCPRTLHYSRDASPQARAARRGRRPALPGQPAHAGEAD